MSATPLAIAPVPLVRLDNADPPLFAELMAAVERVASQAAFTLGEEVEAFEREFADHCEAAHAIGVSSGTEALALALRALGVGSGDEVIVPANTFIATAEAVTLAGATPRLVDVDPVTHTITAEIVAASLNPRTACVIPVHLYGRTVDIDPIIAVARRAGIAVVEDACQAHGARYDDRPVGSIGDAGCFSFYPAKNLGGWGDGGAVVTSDPGLAQRIGLLRSHGEQPRYTHRIPGTTGRLDAIQAAILRVKLGYLEHWNERRRAVAAAYDERLRHSAVEPPAPTGRPHDHVYHQYVVTTPARDELRSHLRERGVASGLHYPQPIHLSEAYADLALGPGSLPVAERLARELCSLPIFPGLRDDEVEAVAAATETFTGESGRVTALAS